MDTNIYLVLLLSFCASISTVLGAFVLLLVRSKSKNNNKILAICLGFAAGVMLSVAFLDLYPNMLEILQRTYGNKIGTIFSLLSVIIGIMFGFAIDEFVPHDIYDNKKGVTPHKDLFRVGMVSTIAVALHNFPEGIATFMTGYADITMGFSIALAIAMHNIPEGITIAMPIYYSTKSRRKAIKYTIISGMCEFFGAIVACIFLKPFLSEMSLGLIFGIVSGIMIYISVEELIPSSKQYGFDKLALIATFVGICIMPLSHVI